MDALKNFWKAVLQYQFWILACLVFMVSAVVFFLTKSSLATMITGRTTKLNSTFDQIQQIKGIVPTHPNMHSHSELDKLALKLEGEVKEAWNLQYNRQAKLLVWPSKAFPPGTKALEIFKNLRPIEQYVDFLLFLQLLESAKSPAMIERSIVPTSDLSLRKFPRLLAQNGKPKWKPEAVLPDTVPVDRDRERA